MTYEEIVKYLIESKAIDGTYECPPDEIDITHKCSEFRSCRDCWHDFLRNRYKNYKG